MKNLNQETAVTLLETLLNAVQAKKLKPKKKKRESFDDLAYETIARIENADVDAIREHNLEVKRRRAAIKKRVKDFRGAKFDKKKSKRKSKSPAKAAKKVPARKR